jgi:putative component of membrane protein insertase Oxa1/YidC/SpoIIIJ protein YidD
MTAVSHLACRMIEVYQRHVSPRKGFRCAFRVLHGGDSCSSFAKRAIARFGPIRGLWLLRRRFQRCRFAARVLDHKSPRPPAGVVRRDRPSWGGGGGGCGPCSDEAVACCAIEAAGWACCGT